MEWRHQSTQRLGAEDLVALHNKQRGTRRYGAADSLPNFTTRHPPLPAQRRGLGVLAPNAIWRSVVDHNIKGAPSAEALRTWLTDTATAGPAADTN